MVVLTKYGKHESKQSLVIKVIFVFLAVGIVFFVIKTTISRGLFEYIGVDYRLWYSTGSIIRYHGVPNIYDFNLQAFYQQELFNEYSIPHRTSMDFWPLPLPYLSIFTLPMVFLTLFQPIPGLIIWTVINLFVSFFYIKRFLKKYQLMPRHFYILIFLLSFPFVLNTLFAQVNLILLISFGEFILNSTNSRGRVAGAWMAGLLIKPQLLILLIPVLIYLKKWKILLGFTIASVVIILLSILLVGFSGLKDYASTILNWPSVLGDSGMNLLALETNFKKFMPDTISIIIILFLYILFLVQLVKSWINYKKYAKEKKFEVLIMSTLLTTFTVSPHSNVYMAIMIIPLGFVIFTNKIISEKLVFAWLIFPITLFLLVGTYSVGTAHAIVGMAMLFVNMIVSNALQKALVNY